MPDGTIPEVKMTSQGVGKPFAPGEKIMGYQACEVHGGCYIDTDDVYGEKLTKMTSGSEAVFRYVRSDKGWNTILLTASGKGSLQVLMGGKPVGTVDIQCEDFSDIEAPLAGVPGEYELCLRVQHGKEIEIAEIVLKA